MTDGARRRQARAETSPIPQLSLANSQSSPLIPLSAGGLSPFVAMPPTIGTVRSTGPCWTCKRIRRKCDESRPLCQRCLRKGIHCEGYSTKLKWDSGIASRGHFMGASVPTLDAVPPRPKGRKRDLERLAARSGRESKIQASEEPTSAKARAMHLPNEVESPFETDVSMSCAPMAPVGKGTGPELNTQISPLKSTSEEQVLFGEC